MRVLCYSHLIDIKLIDRYRKELQYLIIDYFKERHDDYCGSSSKAMSVLDYWSSDRMLYFVVDDKGKAIGFLVLYINDQFQMVEPKLVVDYMYVLPEFRRTRATQWLYATIGKVAMDLGLDCLGTTIIGTASNESNVELVGGKTIATVNLMTRDSFKDKYKKYMRSLNCLHEE